MNCYARRGTVSPRPSTRPFLSSFFTLHLRTLLALFVLPCALFAVACSDPEQTKANHLQRGESLLTEKKYEEAELEFRNALQIDQNLAAAYFGLARVNEGLERPAEIAESLRQAIAKDSNHLEARTKLGNYYLIFSRAPNANRNELISEAERLARETLERDPNNIEGHILNGNILFVQGKRDEALRAMMRSIEIDPRRVESQLSLARFYASAGDAAKAEEVYKRAITMEESNAITHLDYGRFLVAHNRTGEAEASFRRAADVEPKNRDARRILASFYLVNKQLDRAEAEYRVLADLEPNRPEGQATLADFYSSVNRDADAVRVYEQLAAKFPDFTRARYRLGEIAIQRGDTAAATKQTEEVLAKNPRDTQALILRARLSLGRDEAREAIKDLQEVLNIEPNSLPGLYYMADANLRINQTEQAREFAAALARAYPNYLPARLLQTQVSLDAGDRQGALRQASELVEALRTATPDSQTTPQLLAELRAKAFTARGAAHLQNNNLSAARADMQAARDAAPNSPASYTNLARIALAEKQLGEAASLYDRALALDAANNDALTGIVGAALNSNRADEAHRRVDSALNANNRNAHAHYLKGQIFGAQASATMPTEAMQPGAQQSSAPQASGQPGAQELISAAEASFRRAVEIDPGYTNAYFSLANLYRNTNQIDRAVAEYNTLIAKRPDNAAAHTLVGMLEDGRGNRAAAAAAYRRALDTSPNAADNTFASNNLAWLAAEHNEGNLDDALRLAQGVVQRFPNQPGYIDTLGWVLHKKGLHSSAIEQLRKAVTLAQKSNADSALYRFHLAAALAANGDRAAARRELEQAVRLGAAPEQNFTKLDEARQMLATM